MNDLADYANQLLAGALVTIELALTSLLFGLLLGLVAAGAKLSQSAWLRHPVTLLSNVLRGIPEFLIILIFYFGISNFLTDHFDGAIEISPFFGGVFALSIIFAAYSSEVFRGAFLEVGSGQVEAGQAYGLNRFQLFWFIRLPLAWRTALPSLNNMWQSLLKDTSLISVVGLEDMLRKAQIGAQYTKQPFMFYAAVAVVYLALLVASNPVFGMLEKSANKGFR